MINHYWFTNYRGSRHCFGPNTDGDLINNKGVSIHPYHGQVMIGEYGEDDNLVGTFIVCDEKEFKILN